MQRLQGLQDRFGDFVFSRVAGPNGPALRERIHGTPGARRFDPSSPVARVHGDAAMFVGGIRAVVLQTLHPVAMQAVSEHSGFRGDLWGRLARTSEFLAVTTFGADEHADSAVARVRRIHEHVRGTTPTGSSYVASDPHLLAWVHVAEIDSFLTAHQVYGKHPLDAAEQDEYVAQAGEVAAALGVLEPPRDVASLRTVLDSYRPELRSTPEAREAVHDVLWNPDLPRMARPGYAMLRTAAVGLLPRWSREPLGLGDRPWFDRSVARGLGQVSTTAVRWSLSSGHARAGELTHDRTSAPH